MAFELSLRRAAVLTGLIGLCGTAVAQVRPPAYGTSGTGDLTISAYGFAPGQSGATYTDFGGARWMTNGGSWAAPVNLPVGARVTAIEIQGCDDTAAGYLGALLYRTTIVAGTESLTLIGDVASDAIPTPGCGTFTTALPVPETIDNAHNSYWVSVVHNGVTDGSTRFQAVRLRYRLQVSPPPATASFADVPTTSPQFRFVEALAAAGITAGCGNGNFCPDAPVTRGQMAVFLSAALGLYGP